MAKGTVYLYCESKQDLFFRAVERELRAWTGDLSWFIDADRPANDILAEMAQRDAAFVEQRPLVADLLTGVLDGETPSLRSRFGELRKIGLQHVIDVLDLGVRQGVLRTTSTCGPPLASCRRCSWRERSYVIEAGCRPSRCDANRWPRCAWCCRGSNAANRNGRSSRRPPPTSDGSTRGNHGQRHHNGVPRSTLGHATREQHMLSVSVEAEEGDEGGIFAQLADWFDDSRLRRIVERHRDDEDRHAQLFRDCLGRLGLQKSSVSDDLQLIRRIADATGSGEGIRSADDVVASYALLLAIEKRGVEQFPLIADAYRPVDPETAEVYLRVARDERGHVRYCEMIGRSFAEDDITWERAVARARALEATAFLEVGVANLSYCGERGWVQLDALLEPSAPRAPAGEDQ